jgi:hypothetical protein
LNQPKKPFFVVVAGRDRLEQVAHSAGVSDSARKAEKAIDDTITARTGGRCCPPSR